MQQELNANYDTIYQTAPGNNNLTIALQPGSAGPDTVQATLLLQIGECIVNNNPGVEGELLMVMRNTLKSLDFELDQDGNLIVHAADAANYTIDSEGNLIYTYR